MKYKRKNILYKWIVLMGLLQGTTTAQTPVDAVWNGSNDAFWWNVGNWSYNPIPAPLSVPNNNANYGYNVALGANSVTLDQSATINTLNLEVGGSLALNNSRFLTLAIDGSVNNGTISLNAGASATGLSFSATQTLSGIGSILLSDSTANQLRMNGKVITFGSGQTLSGAGNLMYNSGGIISQGSITSTGVNALILDPGAEGFVNQGTLSAGGTGGLSFQTGTFTNTGQVIDVQTGSKLTLGNGVSVVGGTLKTVDSGQIIFGVGSQTLDAVTLDGLMNLTNARSTIIVNGLTNTGTIQLNAGASATYLQFNSGDQTVGGTGSIVMGDSAANQVRTNGNVITLGAGQTLSGAGNLMYNTGGIINQGSITATGVNALILDPGVEGFTNQGTLRATGTGGLTFQTGTFTNTGQVIDVQTSSKLTLGNGVFVVGGTLTTVGTGQIVFGVGSQTLDAVTLDGLMNLTNARSAIIANGLINNGTIQLNAGASATYLQFNNGDQTVAGTGSIVMSDSAANQIRGNGNLITLGAGQLLSGAGTVMANTGGLINFGKITADQSNALIIDTNVDGMVNHGVVTVTSSSVIVMGVGGDNITNALTGRINGAGTVRLTTGNFTNEGTIAAEILGNVTKLTFEGDVMNTPSSTIEVAIAGLSQGVEFSYLEIDGEMALGGSLELAFKNGYTPLVSDSFEIIATTNGGLVTGSFSNTPGGLYTMADGTFEVTYGATSVVLSNFNLVPEPSSLALLGVGAVFLLRRRKSY